MDIDHEEDSPTGGARLKQATKAVNCADLAAEKDGGRAMDSDPEEDALTGGARPKLATKAVNCADSASE